MLALKMRTKETIKMPHVDISVPMVSRKLKTNVASNANYGNTHSIRSLVIESLNNFID